MNNRTELFWIFGSGLCQALVFFLAFLIIAISAIGLTHADDKSARDDNELHCFVDDRYGRAHVERFISSPDYSEQRTAAAGLQELRNDDIKPLMDPNDSAVCSRFNDIFAQFLAGRFSDYERYAEIADYLDPMAHEWTVSYHKAAEFYFVVIRKGQLKTKNPSSLVISTGDDLEILVYDSQLRLVATRACPGPTCPPDKFEDRHCLEDPCHRLSAASASRTCVD